MAPTVTDVSDDVRHLAVWQLMLGAVCTSFWWLLPASEKEGPRILGGSATATLSVPRAGLIFPGSVILLVSLSTKAAPSHFQERDQGHTCV